VAFSGQILTLWHPAAPAIIAQCHVEKTPMVRAWDLQHQHKHIYTGSCPRCIIFSKCLIEYNWSNSRPPFIKFHIYPPET